MKIRMLIVLTIITALLTACGGGIKNSTPIEAAETFMQGMVDGDRELLDKINRSGPIGYPTHYLMEITNERGLVGMDISEFEFEGDPEHERGVIISYTKEGKDKKLRALFSQEKDGFFFIKLY